MQAVSDTSKTTPVALVCVTDILGRKHEIKVIADIAYMSKVVGIDVTHTFFMEHLCAGDIQYAMQNIMRGADFTTLLTTDNGILNKSHIVSIDSIKKVAEDAY